VIKEYNLIFFLQAKVAYSEWLCFFVGKHLSCSLQLMRKSNGEMMVRVFKEFQKVIGLPIHIIYVFWDKDSEDYRHIEKILGILQNEISSDVLSASEWDNKVYTCGDVKSQQALFLETCNAF
jgi:hypothetical protein